MQSATHEDPGQNPFRIPEVVPAGGRWRLASHVEAMEAFDCQQKGHVASESTSVSLHHRPDSAGKTLGIHCSGTERRLPTRTAGPGSCRQPDNHDLQPPAAAVKPQSRHRKGSSSAAFDLSSGH